MNDELPRLLSLLSHELRAPLGVVRGYLRLLDQQATTLSEQQRHAVAAALGASDRAVELLAQASTLAQLRRGETLFNFEEAALEPILTTAVDGVALPDDPVVRLQLAAVPTVKVLSDEAMLRSAFSSLIGAVVRAQPRDATLIVRTRLATAADGKQEVVVTAASDAGAALSETPLNVARGGLGLDLPIAEMLIAAHRGRVRELRDADQAAGIIVWLPTSS